jgi:hypothetical protein
VTLSEDVTLTVAITTIGHGHVVRDRCSVKGHGHRSCRLRVTLARLRFHPRAGRRALKLSLRHLRTGHYTALVRATDHAGRRSRTIRIAFTIVRTRR